MVATPNAAESAVPSKQLAARVHKPGGADAIQLETDVPVPQPGPDEVLIRVKYAGINFIDTYHRSGLYPVPLPFTLGTDGTGVVVAVGSQVPSLKPLKAAALQPGDKVGFLSRGGAYAQYVVVPANRVVKVPDGLDLSTSTVGLAQAATSLALVKFSYPVKAGDWVLVPAAAGGCGQLIVQLAKHRGAHVIALVSTPAKAELVRGLGADHVLLSDGATSDEELSQQIVTLAEGKGVHASFDGVGAATWELSKKSLRLSGFLITFGNASGKVPAFEAASITPKAIYVARPSLFEYISDSEDALERLVGEAFDLITSGALKVQTPTVYPLSEAAKAHEDLQGRRTTGKLVLEVP